MTEIEEINDEDLRAAAEFYDNLSQGSDIPSKIQAIAKGRYDVDLNMGHVDRIAARYACSKHSLPECIAYEVGALQAGARAPRDTRKPFTVRVNLELYYEIPAVELPIWATELGVEKCVEWAFDNFPHNNKLSSFGQGGILQLDPVEIAIGTISSA